MSDIQKLKELMEKYKSLQKPHFDDGGEVVPGVGRLQDILALQAGMARQSPPQQKVPTTTTNGPNGLPVDTEDAAEIGQMETAQNPVSPDQVNNALARAQMALEINLQKKKQQQAIQGYSNGGMLPVDSDVNSSSMDESNSSSEPSHLQQILQQVAQNKIPLPNGGLEGKDLADYIKQNPGPVATTGFNPANHGPDDIRDQKDSEDNSDEEDESPIKGPKLASSTKTQDNSDEEDTADSSPKVSMDLKQPQQDPYGDAGLDALKAAQNKDRLIGGIAGLLGGPQAREIYDKSSAVGALQQQRQFQDQTTEHALKQYQLADEKEKNNPNSAASTLARNVLQSSAKMAGLQLGDISKLSASTIEKTFPSVAHLIDTQSQSQQRAEASKDRLALLQAQLGNKQDAKQNQTLQQTQQLLESARGNPAASQAEKDLYSAQKAKSLANLYGDPNKLSQQQVHLLAQEVGKIAAGGVSSQAELQGITPNTLMGQMSKATGNLLNSPSPANAADWVKQYTDYTDALAKDAQKVIQDKYGRVIEAKKGQLSPENYKALQDNYLNRFNVPSERSPQNSSTVKMQAPDGTIRIVPASQKDAAIKAGGKLVE